MVLLGKIVLERKGVELISCKIPFQLFGNHNYFSYLCDDLKKRITVAKLSLLEKTLSERIDRRISLFSCKNKDCDTIAKQILSDAITKKPLISEDGSSATYKGEIVSDFGRNNQIEIGYCLSVSYKLTEDGSFFPKLTDLNIDGNRLEFELSLNSKDNSFEDISKLLNFVTIEIFKINLFRYQPFSDMETERAEKISSECSNIKGGRKSFRYKMASAIKHFKLLENSLNEGFSWENLWNAYDSEFRIRIPSPSSPAIKESVSAVGHRFLELFLKTEEAAYLAELLPFINFRKTNPNKREERALNEYETGLEFGDMAFKLFSNSNFFLKQFENIILEAIGEYNQKIISKQYSFILW